jgi:hypothetical protein
MYQLSNGYGQALLYAKEDKKKISTAGIMIQARQVLKSPHAHTKPTLGYEKNLLGP